MLNHTNIFIKLQRSFGHTKSYTVGPQIINELMGR